jgi:hypothetical protein
MTKREAEEIIQNSPCECLKTLVKSEKIFIENQIGYYLTINRWISEAISSTIPIKMETTLRVIRESLAGSIKDWETKRTALDHFLCGIVRDNEGNGRPNNTAGENPTTESSQVIIEAGSLQRGSGPLL